jgi:hypothetical protein
VRRKPEILILAALLVAAMGFVLWYVIDRRARLRAAPPVAAQPLAPAPVVKSAATAAATPASAVGGASRPAVPAEPVDLSKHDRQTIDFSSGQPVVKNAAEDKAAIDAAMKDIESAEKETTFEAPKKEPRK